MMRRDEFSARVQESAWLAVRLLPAGRTYGPVDFLPEMRPVVFIRGLGELPAPMRIVGVTDLADSRFRLTSRCVMATAIVVNSVRERGIGVGFQAFHGPPPRSAAIPLSAPRPGVLTRTRPWSTARDRALPVCRGPRLGKGWDRDTSLPWPRAR